MKIISVSVGLTSRSSIAARVAQLLAATLSVPRTRGVRNLGKCSFGTRELGAIELRRSQFADAAFFRKYNA